MAAHIRPLPGGGLESSDGWSVRFVAPDLLEYIHGSACCLVNVEPTAQRRVRAVLASESASDLFPLLREHLQAALPYLKGPLVLV